MLPRAPKIALCVHVLLSQNKSIVQCYTLRKPECVMYALARYQSYPNTAL